MAYQVMYWERDGTGESLLSAVRIKRKAEAAPLAHVRPARCVRVTLDRTDKQSPVSHILWIKPGYVAPF